MRFDSNDISGIEAYINANGKPSKIIGGKTFVELIYGLTASFTLTGPLNIDPGDNIYLIPVSGLSEPFAVGQLLSLEINATATDNSELYADLTGPSVILNVTQIDYADISGANLIGTKFVYGNSTAINTGVAPYTGEFIPDFFGDPLGFDAFVGEDVNGNWTFYIDNTGASTYTLNSVTLTFAL